MGLFSKKSKQAQGSNLKKLSKTELLEIVKTQKLEYDELKSSTDEKIQTIQEGHEAELLKMEEEFNEKLAQVQQESEAAKAEYETKLEDLEQERHNMQETVSREAVRRPDEPGSIAELAFQINCLMDVAQKTADEYVAQIKQMHSEMSQEYSKFEREAKQKADAILSKANAQAEMIRNDAQTETDDIWQSLQERFDSYCSQRRDNNASNAAPVSNVTPIDKGVS